MPESGHSAYMNYLLAQMMRNGDIASVFLDAENPDTFTSGYIRALSRGQMLLECLTPWGERDGLMVLRTDSVLRVMGGDDFERRLAALVALRAQSAPEIPDCPPDCDLFSELLKHARDTESIATVWDRDNSLTGHVVAINDLHVTLRAMDFMGGDAGEITLTLPHVLLVSVGSEEEDMYQILHQMQKRQRLN